MLVVTTATVMMVTMVHQTWLTYALVSIATISEKP